MKRTVDSGRTMTILGALVAVLASSALYLGYENWQLREEVANTRRSGEAAFAHLYKCATSKGCRVSAKGPEILREFLPDQATLGPTEFVFLMTNWAGEVGDQVRSYLHTPQEIPIETALLDEVTHE